MKKINWVFLGVFLTGNILSVFTIRALMNHSLDPNHIWIWALLGITLLMDVITVVNLEEAR